MPVQCPTCAHMQIQRTRTKTKSHIIPYTFYQVASPNLHSSTEIVAARQSTIPLKKTHYQNNDVSAVIMEKITLKIQLCMTILVFQAYHMTKARSFQGYSTKQKCLGKDLLKLQNLFKQAEI